MTSTTTPPTFHASPNAATAALIPLLATALTVVAGLQLLRSTLAGFSVYLGQIHDLSPTLLGAIIIAVFLSGIAAPLVRRGLRAQRAFLVLAATIALLRLAEQLAGSLDVQLGLSIAGLVLWLWTLPLIIALPREDGPDGSQPPPVLGLLLGIAADTALKGAFGSLDLTSAPGLAPLVTSVALTVAQLGLLAILAKRPQPLALRGSIVLPPGAFALGPFIALQLLLLQNLGHHAVQIGWTLPAAFAWIVVANALAIAAAVLVTRGTLACPRPVLAVLAALLIAAVPFDLPPPLAALTALLGPAILALLLCRALAPTAGGRSHSAAAALGMLAVPLVLFGWYAHYDIQLPFPQALIPPLAVLLVALPALRTPWARSARSLPAARALVGIALLLLALPLYQAARWTAPADPPRAPDSLRVMTFNIHQGFDLTGRHDLEAIARVIESAQPDIVALQEVPRGWVVIGGADSLSWLAQRLRMHAAWGPAADPLWGSAILSRFPIVEQRNTPMPNNDDLTLNRAFLTAQIDLGERGPVRVVATHLHHIAREPHHRIPQVLALLDAIDPTEPTILLGDLNAQPHHAEIALLREAGLLAPPAPIATYPSNRPTRQIDHILATRHFTISQAATVATTASDHLPLTATLHLSR